MKRYHTGLVSTDYKDHQPFPYKGNGFVLHLRSIPPEFQYDPYGSHATKRGKIAYYKGKEIIIEARSYEAAIRVAELLDTSLIALEAPGFACGREVRVLPFSSKKTIREDQWIASYKDFFFAADHFPAACHIACKASYRNDYIYSLAKLKASYLFCSTMPIDLNPSFSPNIPRSIIPTDHVRFAYSIIIAYSVIEQLNLEIRATSKEPSRLKNGEWNPVVRNGLKNRLTKSGIDIHDPFYWDLRGGKTSLEKTHAFKKSGKAIWAHHHVRDVTMELVDAIAYVSWLRSKVSAHKMDVRFVKSLSVYDVSNAQLLARRLILEKMDFL